jgi:hypothetical protein
MENEDAAVGCLRGVVRIEAVVVVVVVVAGCWDGDVDF